MREAHCDDDRGRPADDSRGPRQGRRAEARELLAGEYAWFTEGFHTANLREARALLDELGWQPTETCAAQ